MIETMDLILTGARAGQTVALNGKQFVKGVLRLRGSPEQLNPVISYYGSAYAAFPFRSTKLAEAQARDRMAKHGNDHVDPNAKPGAPNVVQRSGADGDAGKHSPASQATHGGGSDGSQAGGAGVLSDRGGHADAGLRTGQGSEQQQPNAPSDLARIREAVLALDPDVAENWTANGQATVDSVATALNDLSITRKQIDQAAADWTREQAAATKKLAEK